MHKKNALNNMYKVGIATITGEMNYGNRLQNYAMQKILENLGIKAYTLRLDEPLISDKDYYKLKLKKILGRKLSRYESRVLSFEKFDRKYIRYYKGKLQTDADFDKLNKKMDGFICGSDQIWNPNYKKTDEKKFLSFVKNKKKISVAASIGTDTLNGKELARMVPLWEKLDKISVREISAKNIIEKAIKSKVELLVDPTFLLNETDWKFIAQKEKITKKYIFVYLLGTYSDKEIEKLKSKYEEDIILLSGQYENINNYDEEFAIGPNGFLSLIYNSEKVITDSFHAVVFSILFNKKFNVIRRIGDKNNGCMNSRFENLANIFNIDDMFTGDFLIVNYEFTKKQIMKEKFKFEDFIYKNLGEKCSKIQEQKM